MESNSDIVLRVENLSVSFDKETILDNISFAVNKNDAVAIIGPNGAGKTVLFRALLGLVPYRGSIVWESGVRIGYVPQKFSVHHEVPMTVKEFFLLQRRNFWYPDKETLNHLNHELALVGLSESILQRPIVELSGGQLQRILVAWASGIGWGWAFARCAAGYCARHCMRKCPIFWSICIVSYCVVGCLISA